ncbi:Rossman fold protein, TIGR00730 family [Bacterioplanes sanyensis]|uniref:Cytokinin riboside 5'-monophosphate phosphoribohydrolase n=1 Tax=Bacterioplanes sanyensis TaxID=1249553 RepID=A0A222FJT0_9GAMM|nr:TIGR00730 family Rossman fold protein [Bacterioplanes sanyensis]ASP39030.1 Rossman fold protein, TIGR00730 family [Bacterioplanes sanyensis]
MKRLAIYCGARSGRDDKYRQAAANLASQLAKRGIGIVYGGGHTGLMGVVADAALAAGGEVIGVIPSTLHDKEVGHTGLSQLIHVKTMHERKATMAQLADGFLALPGGIGTLDELIEIWCWAGLGDHHKPCACFDVDQYWQALFDLLDHIEQEGFAHSSAELARLASPEEVLRWLNLS